MKKIEYNEFDEKVESPKLVSYVLYYPRDVELIPRSKFKVEKSPVKEDQGLRVSEEQRLIEEEQADELYRDVDINQGWGLQVSQDIEDSHVTLTPVQPDGQQESSSVSSFVTSMLNPISNAGVESIFTTASSLIAPIQTSTPIMTPSTIATITTSSEAPIPPTTIPSAVLQNLPTFDSVFRFEDRVKSLEVNFSKFTQTNQFAEAVSKIPGALGCEFLKNLALMGVSCETQRKLIVTDDDVIEKSNLSRQFLFEDYFANRMKQLIFTFLEDAATMGSILRAETFGIPIPDWAKNAKKLFEAIDQVIVLDFQPKQGAKIETDENVTHLSSASIDDSAVIDELIKKLESRRKILSSGYAHERMDKKVVDLAHDVAKMEISSYLCHLDLMVSCEDEEENDIDISQYATGIFVVLLLRFKERLKVEIGIFFPLVVL
nr:hypothetical protein [Tanacetum cinerariifolium]